MLEEVINGEMYDAGIKEEEASCGVWSLGIAY